MTQELYKITIPGTLPSTNEIINIAKTHWGSYKKMKKDNTELIAWEAKKLPHFERIDIKIKWFCPNKRKDKDNIAGGIKFILDGLVEGGVIDNDGWKQIGNITHEFEVDKINPRIEVYIKEVKE